MKDCSWKQIWNIMKPKTFNDLMVIYAAALVSVLIIVVVELIKIGVS